MAEEKLTGLEEHAKPSKLRQTILGFHYHLYFQMWTDTPRAQVHYTLIRMAVTSDEFDIGMVCLLRCAARNFILANEDFAINGLPISLQFEQVGQV